MKKLTLLIALCASPVAVQALPAFYGAEGGGALSEGGRGGTVCRVTSLADSGSGTLRECINTHNNTSGSRMTVVFRVFGTIQLQSGLNIWNPYLTIAGQTAPGGGIQLIFKDTDEFFYISASHVIIRYLRIRHGKHGETYRNTGGCIGIYNNAVNVIIDHVSTAYNQDEAITVWVNGVEGQVPSKNITVQWTLNGIGLAHTTATVLSGKDYATGLPTINDAGKMTDLDFHNNYYTSLSHRLPGGLGRSSRWVNNIIFNYAWYQARMGGLQSGDFIGNIYRCGNVLEGSCATKYPLTIATCADSSPSCSDFLLGVGDAYFKNNVWLDKNENIVASGGLSDQQQWDAMVRSVINSSVGSDDVTGNAYNKRRGGGPGNSGWASLSPSGVPINALSLSNNGSNLVTKLLDNTSVGDSARGHNRGPVGASRRLDENGNWVNILDPLDSKFILEYMGGGNQTYAPYGGMLYSHTVPDSENEICWASGQCGFPTLAAGSPYTDTDADGMPDLWETANGLNPNNAADRNTVHASGYTMLEMYLNGPMESGLSTLTQPQNVRFSQ